VVQARLQAAESSGSARSQDLESQLAEAKAKLESQEGLEEALGELERQMEEQVLELTRANEQLAADRNSAVAKVAELEQRIAYVPPRHVTWCVRARNVASAVVCCFGVVRK
jgi:TolA-binding protein